jgi:hypothetical protein
MVTEAAVARRWFPIALPPLLIGSMYGAFRYLTRRFGFPTGYLAAFGVYWVLWCVIVPAGILGIRRVRNLFGRSPVPFAKLGVTTHLLLWWPLAFPLVFSFLPRIGSTPLPIVIRVDRARHHHRCH